MFISAAFAPPAEFNRALNAPLKLVPSDVWEGCDLQNLYLPQPQPWTPCCRGGAPLPHPLPLPRPLPLGFTPPPHVPPRMAPWEV